MGKLKQRKIQKERSSKSSAGGGAVRTVSSTSRSSNTQDAVESQPSESVGILRLTSSLLKLLLYALLSLPFWILTYSLSIVYGRPPRMVYVSQAVRYLRYTWSSKDFSFTAKLEFTMIIMQHTVTSPFAGFCWLLDEILYGRQMDELAVEKPLFVVSAYRSASTQMARSLVQDEFLVAPNAAMCNFPYLWFWNLIVWITEDGLTKEEAKGRLMKNFPKECLERHDNDPFAIDTFDGSFLSSHLNGLALRMGPSITVKEFNAAEYAPHNRHLFEDCFVNLVDRLAKKTLMFYKATPDQTFLLKGHFLSSAPALTKKYPDARFLAILRDPLSRIQSGINYMAVNPTLWQGRQPNWNWLTASFVEIEKRYCEREMEWYNGDHEHSLAVRFDSFVKDFERTMKLIYRQLLEREAPEFTPLQKTTKKYTVNRSLRELGVDEAALRKQLSDYNAWMKEHKT